MHFKIGNVPMPNKAAAVETATKGLASTPLEAVDNVTQPPVPLQPGGTTVLGPKQVGTAIEGEDPVGTTQIPVVGSKTAAAHVKTAITANSVGQRLGALSTSPIAGVSQLAADAGLSMENPVDTGLSKMLGSDKYRYLNRAHNRWQAAQAEGSPDDYGGKSGYLGGVLKGMWSPFSKAYHLYNKTNKKFEEFKADDRGKQYIQEERDKQQAQLAKSKRKDEAKKRYDSGNKLYQSIDSNKTEGALRSRGAEGDEEAASAIRMLDRNRKIRDSFWGASGSADGWNGGGGGFGDRGSSGGGGYGSGITSQQKQLAGMGSPTGQIGRVGSGGRPSGFYSATAANAMSNPWMAHQLMGGEAPKKFFPATEDPKAEGAGAEQPAAQPTEQTTPPAPEPAPVTPPPAPVTPPPAPVTPPPAPVTPPPAPAVAATPPPAPAVAATPPPAPAVAATPPAPAPATPATPAPNPLSPQAQMPTPPTPVGATPVPATSPASPATNPQGSPSLPKPTTMAELTQQGVDNGMSPGDFANSRGFSFASAGDGTGSGFQLFPNATEKAVPATPAPTAKPGAMPLPGQGGNAQYANIMNHPQSRRALATSLGINTDDPDAIVNGMSKGGSAVQYKTKVPAPKTNKPPKPPKIGQAPMPAKAIKQIDTKADDSNESYRGVEPLK